MKLERWNPSLKAGTILISVILLSFQYLVSLNLLVFGISLLLLLFCSDARPRQIGAILIPAAVAAFGLFVMGLYYSRGSSITDSQLSSISAVPYAVRAAMSQNLYSALQLATRLLAYAGLGILFALSTDGEYFISSLMHQCRLSPKFAYGILAAFHLMPGMIREFRSVRTAFAVRGVHAGALSLKPIFTMLVNSVRWSESVAMAMESKGFCGEAPRSYYAVPKVRWADWAGSFGCIGAIIAGMLFLRY
ncbi:MAG: energy-coupling factor transporter transmembrane protein EcfT [Oscillospiraceae bacterium]|nr:energy-coupling factor transporter transmembrane protein EcfT [Oscillospiraceae bacterium]